MLFKISCGHGRAPKSYGDERASHMACLNTLKQEIRTLESIFSKNHERFQIVSASVDELSCRFIGKNGKKYEIHANITVSQSYEKVVRDLCMSSCVFWHLTYVRLSDCLIAAIDRAFVWNSSADAEALHYKKSRVNIKKYGKPAWVMLLCFSDNRSAES